MKKTLKTGTESHHSSVSENAVSLGIEKGFVPEVAVKESSEPPTKTFTSPKMMFKHPGNQKTLKHPAKKMTKISGTHLTVKVFRSKLTSRLPSQILRAPPWWDEVARLRLPPNRGRPRSSTTGRNFQCFWVLGHVIYSCVPVTVENGTEHERASWVSSKAAPKAGNSISFPA